MDEFSNWDDKDKDGHSPAYYAHNNLAVFLLIIAFIIMLIAKKYIY